MNADATATAADAVAAAIRSGGKVARLRRFAAVCPHNRQLAAVLVIDRRPIMVTRLSAWGTVGNSPEPDDALPLRGGGNRLAWVRHDAQGESFHYLDERPRDAVAAVATDCCARNLAAGWLLDQLASGKRRIVLQPDTV